MVYESPCDLESDAALVLPSAAVALRVRPAFETLTIVDAAARVHTTSAPNLANSGTDPAADEVALPIVHVEWTAAGSVAPPDRDRCDDPYLNALAFAARDDRRLRRQYADQRLSFPKPASPIGSSVCSVAAPGGMPEPATENREDYVAPPTAAAADDAEASETAVVEDADEAMTDEIWAAFRGRVRPRMPAAAGLVAFFAAYIIAAGLIFGSPPIVFAPCSAAILLAGVAALLSSHTMARMPCHQRNAELLFNVARAALLVGCSLIACSIWLLDPAVQLRNNPLPVITVLVPLANHYAVDTLSVPSAALVLVVFVAAPSTFVFIPRYAAEESASALAFRIARSTIVGFGGIVAVVWYIHRETRLPFIAQWAAERRAAASSVQLARLRALVQGMIPAHAIARAVEESGIEALRQRVTTVPDIDAEPEPAGVAADEQHNNSSTTTDPLPADEQQRLRELAATLRQDHSDAVVDEYSACLVLHILLPPSADGDDGAGDPLTAAWGHVCSAVDAANAALADTLARTLAVDHSNHGQAMPLTTPQGAGCPEATLPGAVPYEDNRAGRADSRLHAGGRRVHADADEAMLESRIAPAPATAAADTEAATPDGDALLDIATRIGMRRPLPLRILEQRGDRVVIGGPLVRRRADGSSASSLHAAPCAAAAAVLVMRQLADTVPGVACGATVGDAAAAMLGRGTLRYGVYGVLKHHAADLAEAAGAAAGLGRPDGQRASVAALSQEFVTFLGAAGHPAVERFLGGLARDRHPWALRSLGRSRPFLWVAQDRDKAMTEMCGNGPTPSSPPEQAAVARHSALTLETHRGTGNRITRSVAA
jgi:hypothetical protein